MTLEQYQNFDSWYTDTCKYGLFSFRFPRIDSDNPAEFREYRFADGGSPQYSNVGGKIIDVAMGWVEV